MTCGVSQDIMCFTAGENWPIEDTLHGTDGAVLNLTGATVILEIYDGSTIDLQVAMNIRSPPTLGVVFTDIDPAEQLVEGITGYRVYFFSVKATLGTGEVTYQNRGLVYVASQPGAA